MNTRFTEQIVISLLPSFTWVIFNIDNKVMKPCVKLILKFKVKLHVHVISFSTSQSVGYFFLFDSNTAILSDHMSYIVTRRVHSFNSLFHSIFCQFLNDVDILSLTNIRADHWVRIDTQLQDSNYLLVFLIWVHQCDQCVENQDNNRIKILLRLV